MKHQANLKGSIILCSAALLWGFSLVIQGDVSTRISPFLFNFLRAALGSAFLLVVLALRRLIFKKSILPKDRQGKKQLLLTGLLCGLFLTVCLNLQQFGLALYPEGVAAEARCGFLTSLYVVVVPLLSVLFGKRLSLATILSVALACAGVYFLCLSGGFEGIYLSDVLILLCAFFFSFQILAISRYGEAVDGIALSMLQLGVFSILSGILSFFFETPTKEMITSNLPSILFLGIFASGVAYTMQILGQKDTDPTLASLCLSLEGVFGAFFGWILSGHALSPRELLGCALIFLSVILMQLLPILEGRLRNADGTRDVNAGQ